MNNYLAAKSLTVEEFEKLRINLAERDDSTITSPDDISKMETILDLGEGVLQGEKYYVSGGKCSCGRKMSFYDVIFTALIEQWHDPSFLAHTLVGSKYFVNESRPLRCSSCGIRSDRIVGGYDKYDYSTPKYGCCRPRK